ncbi:hypothetical protein MRB53_006040 [Persea americana]|uniref:Uncharacterized protein n=1 Tax=Persea americana TaxID=3435 RepID=A0ACC2MEU6_PERAE|nr:hypothetical protein MRB53_006040 [Persea americana]
MMFPAFFVFEDFKLRFEMGSLQMLLPLYSVVSSARLMSCLGVDSRSSRSLSHDVACQSPSSALATDLAYYKGIVASLLQMVQSFGESLSSIGSKVAQILALCAKLTRLSRGPALDVVELLLAKKGALESDYAIVCGRVAVVTPRSLVAQLACLRSRRALLEKEIADLDILVKDQQSSLDLDSSKMKSLEQSLSLVDADLHKLSTDPAFLNDVRVSYTSSVESEARGCIDDVLLYL